MRLKPIETLITPNLYTRYSSILALSDIPLFIADAEGNVLMEFNPSPEFCTKLCNDKNNCVCRDYLKNFKEGKEGLFTCKNDLENLIIPIKSNGEVLGFIGGIQSYNRENDYKKFLINMDRLANPNNLDKEQVAKIISMVRTVGEDKMKTHEHLSRHIAGNMAMDLVDTNNDNDDVARLSIEKEILEKKIIDLEAKNMSLVINPHFLFNTLNCIARIAYFEKSKTTEELIYCLSDLLRYNLRQDDQLHTIASEIDNIEKYLYIQSVRFKNRLEYDIDIPENIRSYRIPNMVIQPLVENAIVHAITPKRDGGRIDIRAEEKDDRIIISIIDNGGGFSKDVLDNIFNPDYPSGIGFRSTDNRIKNYYGKEYGLAVTKSDFSGSIVTVTIPLQNTLR